MQASPSCNLMQRHQPIESMYFSFTVQTKTGGACMYGFLTPFISWHVARIATPAFIQSLPAITRQSTERPASAKPYSYNMLKTLGIWRDITRRGYSRRNLVIQGPLVATAGRTPTRQAQEMNSEGTFGPTRRHVNLLYTIGRYCCSLHQRSIHSKTQCQQNQSLRITR